MNRPRLILAAAFFMVALICATTFSLGGGVARAESALDEFIKKEMANDGCLRRKHGSSYSIKFIDEIFTTYEFAVTFGNSKEEMYFKVEESGWLFWASYAVDDETCF